MTAMSGENKITVRVDVVIEGAGEAARLTTLERPNLLPMAGGFVTPFQIVTPGPSSSVPVYIIGGKNCIEATGASPVVQGSYARKVWAMAYPSPYVDPRQSGLSMPPYGAVCDTPTGGGGWSFTRAKGNAVPGAAIGGPSGPPNSTLVVWYDFGGSSPPPVEYVCFRGYLTGSGGGSGAGREGYSPPGPAVLHATFTATLAPLGSVPLAWNGAAWVGGSPHCGGCNLSFLQIDGVFTLVSTGPGTVFVATGPQGSVAPFCWSATGTAVGTCSGPFTVTLTE